MYYFVDAEYVKARLQEPDVLFVDARGEDALLKGTLPRSIVLDWRDLANVDIEPGEDGWGHIPDPKSLSEKLGKIGLDKNKEIIIFSGAQEAWGEDGRIFWELRAAGYPSLKMVNGGIQALEEIGIVLTHTPLPPKPVQVEISSINHQYIIDTETLTRDFHHYKLVDTRENDEYEGAIKFGEAIGGHIPGSINIPFSSIFDGNYVKSKSQLQSLFHRHQLREQDSIVVYCTGGIRSAFMQLILEMCGYAFVKSYQGSYYNWCTVNPVE